MSDNFLKEPLYRVLFQNILVGITFLIWVIAKITSVPKLSLMLLSKILAYIISLIV